MTLRRLLLVALGGTVGTAARLAIALLIPDAGAFPLATLAVNLVGALLIGILATRLPGSSDTRVFLGTGILGGFTTYSAFAVGAVQLWAQSPLLAGLYVILTLTLGVAAAVLGMRVGRRRGTR
ncbi:fluoride efflux transporter FluC [Microbacterium murale]|uniref:Fluoride-specific ion channel FluC n=1 Tax=Microbacterium murale TaxID=1081040 RepID=A0ABQ1S2F5_9MICO|nr:CrcB family protein [Microbacterium murale]GGD90538.1 putative fluoride ion transporter CrcB [Microbacterium murale]